MKLFLKIAILIAGAAMAASGGWMIGAGVVKLWLALGL